MGIFSKPLNTLAVCWLLIIVPALCFPAVKGADLTPLTMNWTCLIYGGAMFLAMSYYAVSARKWFKGPRINVEHIHQVDTPGLAASDSIASDERGVGRKVE